MSEALLNARFGGSQVVFYQSEPADAILYVQKGKVKLTVVSDNGKEAVIAGYKPRNPLPERR